MGRLGKAIIFLAAAAAAAVGITFLTDSPDLGEEAAAVPKADPVTAAEPGDWEIETVDVTGLVTGVGYESRELCLALDERDSPRILYFKLTRDPDTGASVSEVKWACRTDGTWKIETVESVAGFQPYQSLSLALDRDGHPHIAYIYKSGKYELRYAHSDGRRWEVEAVDAAFCEDGWCDNPALVLDVEGRPVIAYYYESVYDGHRQRDLRYARRTGNRWEVGTVASGDVDNVGISATADSRGRPHIVFVTFDGVKYARLTEDGWDIRDVEPVDEDGFSRGFALALDRRGNPYIAYYYAPHRGDVSTEDLRYARWAGRVWRTETVDAPGYVGWGCALALDRRGFPHISYRSRYNLKFAHWTGTEWFVQTVAYGADHPYDAVGAIGTHTAVAVDGDDRPHIAYLAGEDGELKYASWTGGAWKKPARREPEIIRDRSADGFAVTWGPEVISLGTGGPWPPPICDSDIWEALAVYAEPEENAAKAGEIPAGTPVEVLDGRSVWTPYEDEFTESASYETWLKVRAAGVEGWLSSGYVTVPEAVVGFAAPYAPLREGPSGRAAAVKPEESDRADGGWGLTAAVPAGAFFPLNARCRDWLSVGGGWLAADTPGLVFYVPTYTWFPYTKDKGGDFQYTFYFPVGEYVARVIYLATGYFLWFELHDNPLLTVITERGEFDATPERRRNLSWHETVMVWYEAVLPRPIKRDNITAVTFTMGEKDEKCKFTLDPREAWAEYDAQR